MSLSKNFAFSEKIVKNISEISQLQGEISSTKFSIEERQNIRKQSFAESSYYSTKIEGNTLTLKQVTDSLAKKTLPKKTRELKEIINYAKARQFVLSPNVILNERQLLNSHDILLSGIITKSMRGKYRNLQNAIKDSKTGAVVYLPPEWTDVKKLMLSLFKICTTPKPSYLEAIINSGIFHFHFESIHPFLDGNGRLGRLWSTNLLVIGGLTYVELVSIEKFHEINRKSYYERLHELQGNIFYDISPSINLTSWLEYWTDGLVYSAQEAHSKITEIPSQQNEELILEKRLALAVKLFKTHKKMTAEQYQLLTNIGRTQAVEDLNKLKELGFIKKAGGGRSTVYLLA